MGADVAVRDEAASASRPRPGRWVLLTVVAVCLLAAYPTAIVSTHAVLSASPVGWSGGVPGHGEGLATATTTERELVYNDPGYLQVLWASRPGGQLRFGFDLHNGGLAPITVLGVAVRGLPPGVVHDLVAAGTQLGPDGRGTMRPFHRVTLGPGASVSVALTERVVCDPLITKDARLPGHRADTSVLGDATSPVVVHYRVLGLSTSQTLTLASPLLVLMPYRGCK